MTRRLLVTAAVLAVLLNLCSAGVPPIGPLQKAVSASSTTAAKGKKSGSTGKKATGSSGGSDPSKYQGAFDTIGSAISSSNDRTKQLLGGLMDAVKNDPGQLITRNMLDKLAQQNSFLPQKAGTRSVSLQSEQGFNGFSNYQPSGWVMTETMSGPAEKMPQTTDESVPVYTYPQGLGPVLINGCTANSYSETSPCFSSKHLGRGKGICPNLMDAAAYVGVGFDGRGYYKIESRRASLVQRACFNMASFLGKDVPDTMNVFGIFETTAETRSFQSADEYLRFIREKAGLSEQRNLFLSEATKHSKSSGFGMNLGAIGSIAGGAIGAAVGGPAGAQVGASLGSAVGGGIEGGTASGSGSSSSTNKGTSRSSVTQTDKSNGQQSASNNFFAIMYVNIILFEITLDEVKPKDINLAALKDYMSLPESYFSIGADVSYQNFLLRWGTHFIRSGKFGGQLKITKTAKTDKLKSAQEFASIAETEFQSMFSTLQSKYSQESSSWNVLGFGGEKNSASQNSNGKSTSQYRSTLDQRRKLSQSFRQSEFTHTTVEAQGGTPEIAEALVDFYTPAFRQLYNRWIDSIKDYVKPFEFQLKSIDQLFNMNMDDLFPSGNLDFGCMGGAGGKVKFLVEPGTKRRYYLDVETSFENNKTTTTMVKTYCKYNSLKEFKIDLVRRRISLEKAVAVYMAEGPFPTSSFELNAGQPGCDQETLAELNLFSKGTRPLKFAELSKAPFLIAFDLPADIPNMLKSSAKYIMLHRADRWFATEPGQMHIHLYDGCQLVGYKPAETKICFKNIILTYEESSGFFHIDPKDFAASKRRNPILPDWLRGSTVARASKIDLSNGTFANSASVPCNVKWMNSHRLDPGKDENCIHFTAASSGDIFVNFASIPKDHTTWYYLQINMDGVAFYKAMHLQKRDYKKGMGTLGDRNLYQSYFVCVNQADGEVLMQFGKADSNSDVGTVYSGYKFAQDSQYSRLTFYSFGSGSKSVSLMDIRLTRQMPKVECLNNDYILKNGHCVLNCHKECIDCNLAKDDKSCFKCRNVRIEIAGTGSKLSNKVIQCLPECPKGYDLSNKDKKLCQPCSPGKFKDSVGNQKCSTCFPGSFSASGASNCSVCSPGTFSAKLGSAECEKCPAGSAAKSKGSKTCSQCSAGTFSKIGQVECTPCPVGHFIGKTGQSKCQLCQAGFYAANQGMQACTKCPAGTSSTEGSVSCDNNCKRGEFSPKKGVACKKCQAGTFTPSSGSSSCTRCPTGSFQAQEGQGSCRTAPAGSYAAGPGAKRSTPCPAGTYNPKTGKSSSSSCVPCSAGSYSKSAGSTVCTRCPKGSYQPLKNQKECKSASPGRFVELEGQSVQKLCPPGKISGAAASTCTPCSAGSFANQIGSTSCSRCSAGSWSAAGASFCKPCNAGTISGAGATTCTQCTAGRFADKAGSSVCKDCAPGTWSSAGATSCINCPLGTYSAAKASVCTRCPPGKYADAPKSVTCKPCRAGSVSKTSGSRACTFCPAGYMSSAGATSCSACPVGHYSKIGSSKCTPCAAGKYVNKKGAASCAQCLAGQYSNAGSAHCTACPPGKYSNTVGSSTCKQCDLNFALAVHSGRVNCDLCPNLRATRDARSCLNRAKPAACQPMDTCLSASDNDQWSYAEVPRAQSLFFTFSHPINVRKIVIYTRADCCKERARNLQIGLASPKHGNKYCNTDNTAFSYRRVISCHHDYVTLIVVKQRIASHLSLSIHFMTE